VLVAGCVEVMVSDGGAAVAVVVDGAGNLYVTNISVSLINIYAPGASGNVAPIVSFGGNCVAPDGIALDVSNHIYVSCDQNYEIREYSALSGTQIPTQIRSLGVNSSQPQLYNPSGIAVNSLGTLFVANTANDTIVKIPLGSSGLEPGTPEVFVNRAGGGPGLGVRRRVQHPDRDELRRALAVARDGSRQLLRHFHQRHFFNHGSHHQMYPLKIRGSQLIY